MAKAKPKRRVCKDCPPSSKRRASYPGPRCATHHRAVKQGRQDATHARYIAETYSLTAEDFDALYEAQDGLCGVCGRTMRRTRPRPSIDHDHACCAGATSCGQCVRGLTHRSCNKLLGYWRDDPQRFRRAAEYLEQPPAYAVLRTMRS